MLGPFRLGFREIKDLPPLRLPVLIRPPQGLASPAAGLRKVLLDPVRVVHLAHRRAAVPSLAPAAPSLAAGPLAGRRFRRPIARRGFPAVAALEVQVPPRLLPVLPRGLQLLCQLLSLGLPLGFFRLPLGVLTPAIGSSPSASG